MCVEEEKAVEKEWGGVFLLLLLFYQVKYFKIIKCCIHSRGKFSPDSLQKNSKSCILELAPLVLMMLGCWLPSYWGSSANTLLHLSLKGFHTFQIPL